MRTFSISVEKATVFFALPRLDEQDDQSKTLVLSLKILGGILVGVGLSGSSATRTTTYIQRILKAKERPEAMASYLILYTLYITLDMGTESS